MKTCAFLSMESLEGFFSYDELLVEPFRRQGWEVSFVPWRSRVDWSDFDAVVIRTTWDYYLHPDEFLAVLERIGRKTRLENPLEIVRWNMQKTYLLDLQTRGVPIPPTVVTDPVTTAESLQTVLDDWRAREIVLKPLISANAANTHRIALTSGAGRRTLDELLRADRWLVQPFIDSVVTEGECSLFYFAGAYSHAINKRPAPGDYRVQEEHGGLLRSIEPDPELRDASDRVMRAVGRDLLYARVDLIRHEDRWYLMELELIEPSLYFNMDAESPERFARRFAEWCS